MNNVPVTIIDDKTTVTYFISTHQRCKRMQHFNTREHILIVVLCSNVYNTQIQREKYITSIYNFGALKFGTSFDKSL